MTPLYRDQPSLAAGIFRGIGAKLVVLPIAAVATLSLARLVTETLGIQAFAAYVLIAGLPLLVPFLDFGMGASLASAGALASSSSIKRAEFTWLARRTFLIAIVIAASLSIMSLGFGAGGLWIQIVGLADRDLNWAIAFAMATFAFSIPGSLSYSILLGVGQNGIAVVIQGLTPVASLTVISVALALGAETSHVIALACAGPFLTNWIAFGIARRQVRTKQYSLKGTVQTRPKIANTAGPMILLMLSGAAYLHSGRLVVAHLGDTDALATFAAAWLVFQPLWSVMQTAARSLWPHFARSRETLSTEASGFGLSVLIMSGLGLSLGILLLSAGPLLADYATSGKAETSLSLFVGLGVTLLLQGMLAAAGMYLTYPNGLWLQVVCSSFAAIGSLAFSISTFGALGSISVVVGLAIGILMFQVIPLNIAAALDIRRKGSDIRE